MPLTSKFKVDDPVIRLATGDIGIIGKITYRQGGNYRNPDTGERIERKPYWAYRIDGDKFNPIHNFAEDILKAGDI